MNSSAWETRTLGDISRRVIGRTPPRKEARFWTDDSSERPFISIANMKKRLVSLASEGVTAAAETEGKAKRVPRGSLILSFKLSLGRVGITDRDVFTNEAIAWIQPEPCVLQSFLALALENIDWDGLGRRAIKGKTLNSESLDALQIPLPPLTDQGRIVDLMESIDSTIEAVEEGVLALEDALRARRSLAMLASRDIRRAGDVFSIVMGRHRAPTHASGDHVIPYLRSANVLDGSLDLTVVNSMNFTPTEQKRYCLRAYDVMVTEGSASPNSVGAAALWSGELPGAVAFQNTLLRYRAVEGATIPMFVYHWCKWAYESGIFRESASGSTILHIGSTRADNMLVNLPDLEQQEKIVEILESFEQAISIAREKLTVLKNLRRDLLSALLSGAHRIPETYDELLGADLMNAIGA